MNALRARVSRAAPEPHTYGVTRTRDACAPRDPTTVLLLVVRTEV
jgi:hypothetical protein